MTNNPIPYFNNDALAGLSTVKLHHTGSLITANFGITKKDRPKVLLINTGGTIGMVKTPSGYAPKEGEITKVIAELEAASAEQLPQIDLLEYSPLLDSSDMTYREWVKLAEDILARIKKYTGVVILHGTDTMAFTAAALSFMLGNLKKPVILTGSQIPLCQLRSDGRENLVTALVLAAKSKIPEVMLYFGGKLLRGNRATKISADNLMAFDSPNYPVLGEAGVDIRVYPDRCLSKSKQAKDFIFKPFTKQAIGVLKVFPGLQFSLFENLVEKGLNGLILEAFGVGNIPFGNNALEQLLKSCSERQIVTVVCTQCPQGRARLGEYSASSALCAMGAVSGMDLTVEAAIAKLTYLLSLNLSYDDIRYYMQVNLRGELTPAD